MDGLFIVTKNTSSITNDNYAIEEWTFDNGGTCRICVTHLGLQFTFHRKSRDEEKENLERTKTGIVKDVTNRTCDLINPQINVDRGK